jgi:hypothetical protein
MMKLQSHQITRSGIVLLPAAAALAPHRCKSRRTPLLSPPAAGGPGRGRTKNPALQELDLAKLYTDATYVPARLIGPVEVAQATAARPRRAVVTRRDVPTGALLFVSEPLAFARGAPGESLRPVDLAARLLAAGPLSDAEWCVFVLFGGESGSGLCFVVAAPHASQPTKKHNIHTTSTKQSHTTATA